MKRTRMLRSFACAASIVTLLGLGVTPALAADTSRPCSVQSIAGSWSFATDVGQLVDQNGILLGHLVAIGTMNIDRNGNVMGEFDYTRRRENKSGTFLNVAYWGVITVGPDCRGTLTFETSAGAQRKDSIAVLNSYEMLAITRAPAPAPDVPHTWNLWTYRIARISSANGQDMLETKIDALLGRLGIAPGTFQFQKDQ